MCVYLQSWVALLLAGSTVRDLELKASLPAWLPVSAVSVATVAFQKPRQKEKNKSSAARKNVSRRFTRLESVLAADGGKKPEDNTAVGPQQQSKYYM